MAEETPDKMPMWVKALGIVLIVVAILVAIMANSGGDHGPGRHIPSGDNGSQTIVSVEVQGCLL